MRRNRVLGHQTGNDRMATEQLATVEQGEVINGP